MTVRAMLAAGVFGLAAQGSLVEVTQFYMAQCPMSSTLLSDFHWRCMENGVGIKVRSSYLSALQ